MICGSADGTQNFRTSPMPCGGFCHLHALFGAQFIWAKRMKHRMQNKLAVPATLCWWRNQQPDLPRSCHQLMDILRKPLWWHSQQALLHWNMQNGPPAIANAIWNVLPSESKSIQLFKMSRLMSRVLKQKYQKMEFLRRLPVVVATWSRTLH